MIALQGSKIGPAGARKASVTKRRNMAPGFNTPDPKIVLLNGDF